MAGQRGRKRRTILQLNTQGNEVRRWEKAEDLVQAGMRLATVRQACNEGKNYKGFLWRYDDEGQEQKASSKFKVEFDKKLGVLYITYNFKSPEPFDARESQIRVKKMLTRELNFKRSIIDLTDCTFRNIKTFKGNVSVVAKCDAKPTDLQISEAEKKIADCLVLISREENYSRYLAHMNEILRLRKLAKLRAEIPTSLTAE